MQVFDLLTVYAIDFYSFFLPCGAFSTMYSFFLDYKCSLLCFPTETVSNYKTWQSWKMTPEIACFLLFFSPWGSLGLGRELHTFQNYILTQIENQRFSSLCRYLLYGQNAKISRTPPALTCIPSASEELETLCWLKTELKPSSWLTLLLLQCTSSAIKSCAIWVFSVPMPFGFLVQTNLNLCNDKDFSGWNKISVPRNANAGDVNNNDFSRW